MNKKGFALTEVLVVVVFLVSIFTFIYVSIIPLIGKYESSISNEMDIDIVYKLYHVRKMFMSDDSISTTLAGNDVMSLSCDNLSNTTFYTKLMEQLELRQSNTNNYVIIYANEINTSNLNTIKTMSSEIGQYAEKYKNEINKRVIFLLDTSKHTVAHLEYDDATVTITSTANLKATSQTATLKCNDTIGVKAYYWGTAEPDFSDITNNTSVDIINLTSDGLSKPITSAGTYWLGCKDKQGNFTKRSINIYSYVVKNMLQNTDGSAYTTTDYTLINTSPTYIAPKDTTVTLRSVYTIPTGSNADRFDGHSVGNPSTNEVTPTKTTPTLNSDNRIYTMWFTRNRAIFLFKATGGTLTTTTSNSTYTTITWSVDDDGFIWRSNDGAASYRIQSAYIYGAGTFDIYNVQNSSALLIYYLGKWANSWTCESGCTTANLEIPQIETAWDNSTMCDNTNSDCTMILKPKWKTCTANYYCGNTGRVSCGDGKSSIAGSDASSDCFDTVKTYTASSSICTYVTQDECKSGTYVTQRTSTPYTFTAPEAGRYKLEAYGAEGGGGKGTGSGNSKGNGGKGGYSVGQITLTKGQKLYVYPGCKGSGPSGGQNGGGNGMCEAGGNSGYGGGGGGASHIAMTTNRGDLRKYSSNKGELLVVAGGGGGAGELGTGGKMGGAGGGATAGAGKGGSYPGGGATQSAAGAKGDSDCTAAGFGYGGSSPKSKTTGGTYAVGGGGAGYYGGGAASYKTGGGSSEASTGGGGSGYVKSTLTSASTSNGKREGHGQIKITWMGVT